MKKFQNKKEFKVQNQGNKLTVWVSIAVIVFITYLVFSPTLQNDFTNWDDDVYVLENPLVVNNTIPLKEIFKTPVSCNYHPITMLSLAWNHQNGKLDPKGYHAVNIVFHLFNTGLVFLFVFLLSKQNLLMASIAALFFGIHPMHVESVSWISERKDVLYVFFFLIGLIAYLKYREGKKAKWYLITLILFVLSCLSKGMAIVFPAILLLVDYLLEIKWNRKIVTEKIPFFLLAIVFGIVLIKIQIGEAITSTHFFTTFQRMMFASYGVTMYIVKFFVPINLSAYYPYPTLNKAAEIPFFFYLCPFLLLGVVWLIYFLFRKERVLIFGLVFYIVSVFMVLQLISVGTVIMADRYSYLSYIGLLYVVAYYINKVITQKKKLKYPILALLLVIGVIFSNQTYARTKIWKNSETLWTDVIIKSNGSTQADKAYLNRGKYFHFKGNDDKSLKDYNCAINLNPFYALPYNNRGNIYRERGFLDSAFNDYNKAIAIDPTSYLFYANRALIFKHKNEYEASMKDFAKSISLNPKYWANYYNRGLYYLDTKNNEKAIADFTVGILLRFNFGDLYYRRGVSFFNTKKYNEALIDFTKAIELNPQEPSYWIYRSQLESILDKKEEAEEDMRIGRELLGS